MVQRDDIDAISIITPNDLHAEISIAALETGKHVLCEKPMAMDYAQAQKMARAAEQAGVQTGINFSYRGFPAARYCQQIISEGRLGRILHVNAHYLSGAAVGNYIPLVWRLQKDRAGTFALGDIGSHLIDQVEWISGETITSLVADQRTLFDQRRAPDGSATVPSEIDDATALMTRFAGGGMGCLVASHCATARKYEVRLEICGDQGALIYDLKNQENILLSTGTSLSDNPLVTTPVPERFKLDEPQVWRRNVKNFVDAIAHGGEMDPNFSDGLRNQEIQEAVVISARERRWLDLPLDRS
jgi:predicted dehydrogenase